MASRWTVSTEQAERNARPRRAPRTTLARRWTAEYASRAGDDIRADRERLRAGDIDFATAECAS